MALNAFPVSGGAFSASGGALQTSTAYLPESFESGSIDSNYEFPNGSSADWFVDTANAYDGSNSLAFDDSATSDTYEYCAWDPAAETTTPSGGKFECWMKVPSSHSSADLGVIWNYNGAVSSPDMLRLYYDVSNGSAWRAQVISGGSGSTYGSPVSYDLRGQGWTQILFDYNVTTTDAIHAEIYDSTGTLQSSGDSNTFSTTITSGGHGFNAGSGGAGDIYFDYYNQTN